MLYTILTMQKLGPYLCHCDLRSTLLGSFQSLGGSGQRIAVLPSVFRCLLQRLADDDRAKLYAYPLEIDSRRQIRSTLKP